MEDGRARRTGVVPLVIIIGLNEAVHIIGRYMEESARDPDTQRGLQKIGVLATLIVQPVLMRLCLARRSFASARTARSV